MIFNSKYFIETNLGKLIQRFGRLFAIRILVVYILDLNERGASKEIIYFTCIIIPSGPSPKVSELANK